MQEQRSGLACISAAGAQVQTQLKDLCMALMLPSLPTPALDLIWDYLDDEASRKSLLKASKATRHAFGGESHR
eukprot:scaffold134161_cov16-Tisochrysis_lutea.AAC.1